MAIAGVGFLTASVCLFLHDVSNADVTRIAKLDIQMFHDEPWKLIYLGVKRSMA